MRILILGCLLPPPLCPEATVSLDHLGANTARAPLSAVVKCRSNFVLQFKELKKQGVGRGICLTSHHTFPPPTALLVSRAILHRLHEANGNLQILQPELGSGVLWLNLRPPPTSVSFLYLYPAGALLRTFLCSSTYLCTILSNNSSPTLMFITTLKH